MAPELFNNLAQWLHSQGDWQAQPGLWVLGSLLLGVAGVNLLWIALRLDGSGRLQGALQSTAGLTLAWLVRLAWLVLPGYGALLLGAVSPRLMGLTQVDWGARFGYGLLFTLMAWGILLAAGLAYRRHNPGTRPWPTFGAAVAGSIRLFLEAGALQWHWAFYRAAAIMAGLALGSAEPERTGAWLGLALVVLEGALNPFLRRDLRTPGRSEGPILRASLLVASSILFLISRNFWLMWAFHALSALLLEPRLVTDAESGDSGG